jgi:hypothetical protein
LIYKFKKDIAEMSCETPQKMRKRCSKHNLPCVARLLTSEGPLHVQAGS